MQIDAELVVAPGGLYLFSVVQDVPWQSASPSLPWNFPPGQLWHVI